MVSKVGFLGSMRIENENVFRLLSWFCKLKNGGNVNIVWAHQQDYRYIAYLYIYYSWNEVYDK